MAKAHVKLAGCRNADPVAIRTKIARERRDQAQTRDSSGKREIARRPSGFMRGLSEDEASLQCGPHLAERQEAICPVIIDNTQRHSLDQREVEALIRAPGKHIADFIAVQPLERDHVDLDPETQALRSSNAVQNRFQSPHPGDETKFFRLACIETDIDPANARIPKPRCMFGEMCCICRHCQLVKAMAEKSADHLCAIDSAAPRQWLTSGQANAGYSARDKAAREFGNFFKAQDFAARQEDHVFRHAIAAAHVATIGERKPDIAYGTAEAIAHNGGHDCAEGVHRAGLNRAERRSKCDYVGFGPRERYHGGVIDATPQLLNRVQSAPMFLISFHYRDELATMASAAGRQVIAARRGDAAEQRFIAAGAVIAVVDLRGSGKAGLAVVASLAQLVEANGAALLVVSGSGGLALLDAALRAGATHVLSGPLSPAKFALALRSAERFALRMIATHGPPPRDDIWRDQQLGWEEQDQALQLSPALASRLKLSTGLVSWERFMVLLSQDAQVPLQRLITEVRGHGEPRALTHRLLGTDVEPIAHHIRLDPATRQLQGLIERPIAEMLANHTQQRDPLSGLGSINAARQWLLPDPRGPQTVLMIGLTRFEIINNAFGRLTGDAVLRALARRVERMVDKFGGPEPRVARIAGATFLVLLDQSCGDPRVQLLATELADVLERPVIAEGHEVSVGCCIGGIERNAGEDAATLLHRASQALADARAPGASTIHLVKAALSASENAHSSLPTDLRNALDRNEIDILFQPQVAISTDEIVGVEALARWAHPVHGTLGAGTLFAVAERSDYLGALSAHIQKRAAEIAARWPESLGHLRLSINVTAQDIAHRGFAQSFLKMLDASGFPRARLTVEITESGLIADLGQAANLLAELRKAGCRVAIDDFGTGYSSLAYLKALPLDYLKIDKALAQDILGTTRDKVVVRGVIDMARSLGLAVIAEGVETEDQRAALAAQGANYYQGFLCAEPIDVAGLEKLVTSS